MTFQVRIQNLGKLADATVRVAPLTVLAGPNNTGKTFFSKALYSVFAATDANPVEIAVNNELIPLRNALTSLSRAIRGRNRAMAVQAAYFGQDDVPAPLSMPHIKSMTESVARVALVAASCLLNGGANADEDNSNLHLPYPDLEQAVMDMEGVFGLLKPEMEEWMRPTNWEDPHIKFLEPGFADMMTRQVSSVRRIGGETRFDLILGGISSKISEEFLENFQIENLADLIGANGENAAVEIDGEVGSISIDANHGWSFIVTDVGLPELLRFSSVIYLESPILWKLKAGLQTLGRRRNWRDNALDEVPSAPGYFYDLVDALGMKYRGEAVAQQEIQHLAKEVVRGKVVINDVTGELQFAEVGAPKPRSLSIVSTGVANVGFLAMLVEKKIVDKNSFLFIDEPEAHLHPVWQVEMLRLLFALAREGVHVVIATHSSDILERLSMLVKENPETQELVALNHFSPDGKGGARVVDSDKDFIGQLDAIQKELTDPFFTSYMEAL